MWLFLFHKFRNCTNVFVQYTRLSPCTAAVPPSSTPVPFKLNQPIWSVVTLKSFNSRGCRASSQKREKYWNYLSFRKIIPENMGKLVMKYYPFLLFYIIFIIPPSPPPILDPRRHPAMCVNADCTLKEGANISLCISLHKFALIL